MCPYGSQISFLVTYKGFGGATRLLCIRLQFCDYAYLLLLRPRSSHPGNENNQCASLRSGQLIRRIRPNGVLIAGVMGYISLCMKIFNLPRMRTQTFDEDHSKF